MKPTFQLQPVVELHRIFSELKNYLSQYEYREQQITMAEKIFKTLLSENKIIVEAPTGIGKSLGYLIPTVFYQQNVNSDTRIVVSTYTKTLQQQLLNKDLPVVNKITRHLYNKEAKYICFYGSENYVCLSKFNEMKSSVLTEQEKTKLSYISEWLLSTETGCVEELDSIDLDFWQELNREPDLCRGKRCKFYDECYYYKTLSQVKKSDLVIVNHHLFFANIMFSSKLFPKSSDTVDIIIFDEAHNIESVALQWLGIEIANTQIKFLCKQIYNMKKNRGLITRLPSLSSEWKENVISVIKSVYASEGQFFSELSSKLPGDKKEVRIFSPYIVEDVLTPALNQLYSLLKSGINLAKTYEEMFKIKSFTRRVLNFISGINLWLKCEDNNYIYWVEREHSRRGEKIILRITPTEIAKDMQEKVYSIYDSIIFTSATLSVHNKLDFFKKSVGLLPEIVEHSYVDELILSSPFDYKTNVILYLPSKSTHIPDPRDETEKYKDVCYEIIKKLIMLTSGNTFVLFTSFDMMNSVYQRLISSTEIEKYKIIVQQGTKYKMLQRYHSEENAVLFGVDTFWQGVDIPGEKLISIIIPKLPFDVPEHPVVEAKLEKIKKDGGDPFREYSLPNAIIKLKQGFGRLIRRKTDWGIVTIIDPRVTGRWYGKYFLSSLPECTFGDEIKDIEKFFKSKKGIK